MVARVTADTKDAEAGLDRIRQKADDASGSSGGGGIKGFITHVAEIAGGMAVFHGVADAVGFLTDQVKDSIQAAQQYELVQAQTNAVLTSTKDASGQTAQSIADLAEHLSTITPFSRDATQAAENMLLTFTNIKGNLPGVTQTTLDFATAMHMDATTAALQLGKALNDPATGYSKLQREGVTFTKSQIDAMKSMEKSGNMAGAQAIMLQELQKEFGGSATAAGKTFAGQLQILQNRMEDTKEKIGTALLPILAELMSAIQPLVDGIGAGLTGALDGLSSFITGEVVPTMQQWMPVIGTIVGAVQTLGGVFMSALQPALGQIGQAFGKVQGPGLNVKQVIGDISGVMHQLTPFVQQAGQVFGKLADIFVTQMIPTWLRAQGAILGALLPALRQIGGFILTQVLPVVMQLVGFFVTNVLPVIEQVRVVIVQNLVPAFMQIASGIITNVWPALKQLIASVEQLWNKISPVLIPALQFLGAILQNVVAPVISNVVLPAIGFLVTAIGDVINVLVWLIGKVGDGLGELGKLKDFLGGDLTNAWNGLGQVVSGVWSGIQGAVKGGINTVISIIDNMISAIDNIHITLPSVAGLGGGSIGFNIPLIPMLAQGGDITRGGDVIVGDGGKPEVVRLPTGARVQPLPSGLTGASGGTPEYVQVTTQITLDGMKLAQVVTKHQPTVIRNATGARSF